MERKYFELAKATYNREDSVVDGITYTFCWKKWSIKKCF